MSGEKTKTTIPEEKLKNTVGNILKGVYYEI